MGLHVKNCYKKRRNKKRGIGRLYKMEESRYDYAKNEKRAIWIKLSKQSKLM